jgi:hypothetical protein
MTRSENRKSSIIVLAVTVGLAVSIVFPGVSLARQKRPTIYNKCGCACYTPATGFGTILDGIQNTAGLPCGAYNNKPCQGTDENGAVISGTTKFCTGDKTSGTKALTLPPGTNPPVLQRRGIEGEPPAPSTPTDPSSGATK